MDASMKVLQRVPLFRGINENDFPHLLNCINAKKKSYARNEFIFLIGGIYQLQLVLFWMDGCRLLRKMSLATV